MERKQELALLIQHLVPYAEALIALKDDIGYLADLEAKTKMEQDRLAQLEQAFKGCQLDLSKAQEALAQAHKDADLTIQGGVTERNRIISEAKSQAQVEFDKLYKGGNEELDALKAQIKQAEERLEVLNVTYSQRSKQLDDIDFRLAELRAKVA